MMHLTHSMKSYLLIRHSPLIHLRAICLAQKILTPPWLPSSSYHHLKVEFSDDEKEMIAKGGRRKKRGGNGKGKGGGDEDSGHTKRDQRSNCCYDGRVHPQRRLQQKMPPNYQRPPQQQLPFSQFQLYNREQPTCAVLQHQWAETRQGGVTFPIQQKVGPTNYQCQQEMHGHEQFQVQQQMHVQQYLPNLQPQWPHHSMLCDQQLQPPHFKQASNQCTVWHGPPQPPQPPLPSTPYHALNLVPSYHDTLREGGPTLDSSPQEHAHD